MANTGTPLPGYTVISGSLEEAIAKILPKDTVRYSVVLHSRDYFFLDLWVNEYYYIGEYEYERLVYMPHTSSYKRRYFTVYADIVHHEKRNYLKKEIVYSNKVNTKDSFYDETLEEKLGGEAMTLGE